MGELIAYPDVAPFDRKLFSLSIPTLDSFPLGLVLPSPHFVLLLACDALAIDNTAMADFADSLIDRGVAYLCAWGPGCELMHHVFDDVLVTKEIAANRKCPNVMTTCHNDENLDEALWYMLYCAYPDEAFAETCGVALAVSVANAEWDAHIRDALSNMRLLDDRVTS